MIRNLKKSEIDTLLKYLKPDVVNCIYMYTDIYMYGLDNPNMKVWVTDGKKEDTYSLVIMKYHDSFQLYSREGEWDKDDIIELVKRHDIKMINGKVPIIETLLNELSDRYEYTSGTIFRFNNTNNFVINNTPEMATLEDVPEIARLLANDEYYNKSYTVEELENQLFERIRTGMGRSAIIRKNGCIVAHCASLTEADGIAVGGGTIAHADYRGQKLGLIVENYMSKYMNEHGYQWFTFITEQERVDKFLEMGNDIVATYAKLVKR